MNKFADTASDLNNYLTKLSSPLVSRLPGNINYYPIDLSSYADKYR